MTERPLLSPGRASRAAPAISSVHALAAIPRPVQWLLLADLTLACLYALDHLLDRPAGWFASHLVNLTREGNLPTWYASAQLLVLGLLLGLFAAVHLNRRSPRSWLLAGLPLLALVLSLDEIAGIHEWLGRKSDALLPDGDREQTTVNRTGIWMLVLGPPFLGAIAVLWHGLAPWLRGHRRIVRLYAAGLAVFLGSALGIELLSNVVSWGGTGHMLQVLCEELGEMIGVSVLVWATLELLAAHGIRLQTETA